MESEWRRNVWEYGLTQLQVPLIATLRTPTDAVAIYQKYRTPSGNGFGYVYPNPFGYETYGYILGPGTHFSELPFPYGIDVLPD